jgi:uncharacterized Zn-binding protein involved in type VI secretion
MFISLFGAMAMLALPAGGQTADTPVQPPEAGCGAIFGGSANVRVEGLSTGRVGDLGCLVPMTGSSSVFVNGRPVLRVGDQVRCHDGRIGVIADGAASVFFNGLPAATAGSRVVGCEPIAAK